MKKRTIAASLTLGIVLMAGLASRLPGQQQPKQYEPWVENDQFTSAGNLISFDRAAAQQQFIYLADQNPGTTLGATSLFTAASQANSTAQTQQIYQRMIQDYPNSRYELQARAKLIRSQNFKNPVAQWQQLEALLSAKGAPTVAQISSNRSRAVDQLRALDPDTLQGVLFLYTQLYRLTTDNQKPERLGLVLLRQSFDLNVPPLAQRELYNLAT